MTETDREAVSYIDALEAVEGVQYVTEYAAGYGVRIALAPHAPFDVVGEITATKPVSLELVSWTVTDENLPAINCHHKDER